MKNLLAMGSIESQEPTPFATVGLEVSESHIAFVVSWLSHMALASHMAMAMNSRRSVHTAGI